MNCSVCGADTILDERSHRRVCSGCNRGPAMCSCRRAEVPIWLQRARASRYGLSKDMTRSTA